MNNYFSKDSCAHNSDYRCFSCLIKFGRSGEHLSEKKLQEVKVFPLSDNSSCERKRPALHLWQPPKRLCLTENRCVAICEKK